MPVLLIWGKEDRLIPYDVALRLQRELPQAKLITLEGCGHLALWDCSDRALPEVVVFSAVAAVLLSEGKREFVT